MGANQRDFRFVIMTGDNFPEKRQKAVNIMPLCFFHESYPQIKNQSRPWGGNIHKSKNRRMRTVDKCLLSLTWNRNENL